jgi:hypothetical protein
MMKNQFKVPLGSTGFEDYNEGNLKHNKFSTGVTDV